MFKNPFPFPSRYWFQYLDSDTELDLDTEYWSDTWVCSESEKLYKFVYLVLEQLQFVQFSHTGHWIFNMAPHGKTLSKDLRFRIVALHKDGIDYRPFHKM